MCRRTEFNHHLKDRALRGHVFKAIFVEDEELCRLNCYLENNCISYNFVKNKNLCELSDSDHRQHPEDLQLMNGFIYGASKVKYISDWFVVLLVIQRRQSCAMAKIHLSFYSFHSFCQLFIALDKGILIPESRNIRNAARSRIQNPESKFHWQRLQSSSWNLEFKASKPESKTVFDSLTWGDNQFLIRRWNEENIATRSNTRGENLCAKPHSLLPWPVITS